MATQLTLTQDSQKPAMDLLKAVSSKPMHDDRKGQRSLFRYVYANPRLMSDSPG